MNRGNLLRILTQRWGNKKLAKMKKSRKNDGKRKIGFGLGLWNQFGTQRRAFKSKDDVYSANQTCRIVRVHQLHEQENPWIYIVKLKKKNTKTTIILHYLITVYTQHIDRRTNRQTHTRTQIQIQTQTHSDMRTRKSIIPRYAI